ncbi:MAG: CDP-alcohol phosphatidyltransferase family protein [Candidatus Saccharibacteria bacterium]|nr:CDP-alcohol phosphatidyltransferase family protein [Candidatus Saccharibacteria bacterium]
MKKMKKVFGWFETAIAHISAPELVTIAINIAAFILNGTFMDNFYLWVVILLCDIMTICAHGAYREVRPKTEKGPWYTPAPLLLRLSSTAILFILLAEGRFDSLLSTYAWYTLTATAVCHAFYCVLLTMHARDNSWLEGTDGRIGTPNWISIGRMALAVLVPHLFAVQPFGKISCAIATAIMAVAIITDAADGYLARKLEQTTNAGKALDPLGDKVIFYPMVVAFFIATSGTAFLPMELRIAFYVCVGIMFARDALFFAWFFHYYVYLKNGIGAGMVDKIRMAAMCIWLGTATLSLTITIAHERLALAGFICMAIVALLSVLSVYVDYNRTRDLLPNKKTHS